MQILSGELQITAIIYGDYNWHQTGELCTCHRTPDGLKMPWITNKLGKLIHYSKGTEEASASEDF